MVRLASHGKSYLPSFAYHGKRLCSALDIKDSVKKGGERISHIPAQCLYSCITDDGFSLPTDLFFLPSLWIEHFMRQLFGIIVKITTLLFIGHVTLEKSLHLLNLHFLISKSGTETHFFKKYYGADKK